MKRRLASFLVAGAGALFWAGACSSTVADGDSESHFLSLCPPGCPSGLECVCGACTRLCAGDAVCGALGSNATCVSHPSCGASKVCDVACSAGADCGSVHGTSCVQGFCRGPGQVPNEAGTGTGGLVGSGGHAGGGSGGDASVPEGSNTGGRGTSGSGGDASIIPEASPGTGGSGGSRSFDDHPIIPGTGILGWDGGPFDLEGGVITCGIPGTIAWTASNVPTADRHEVATFLYDRTTSSGTSCFAVLPNCANEPGITLHDLGVALVDSDVQKALSSSQAGYGMRSAQSTMGITIDGHSFTIGDQCDLVVPECAVPPGLAHLRELLLQLEKQQQGRGDCRPSANCYQPFDSGLCNGNFTRFGYNPATGACETFSYGGCGGNANRFDTKEACEAACDFDPCFHVPALTDGGFCSGGIQILELSRCATDSDTACACSCSVSGHEINRCDIATIDVDGASVPNWARCP